MVRRDMVKLSGDGIIRQNHVSQVTASQQRPVKITK